MGRPDRRMVVYEGLFAGEGFVAVVETSGPVPEERSDESPKLKSWCKWLMKPNESPAKPEWISVQGRCFPVEICQGKKIVRRCGCWS
jgi:hypothetical protein